LKRIHGLFVSRNTSGDVNLAFGIENVGVTQCMKTQMKQELENLENGNLISPSVAIQCPIIMKTNNRVM
jgi:hypothetical protein